MTSQPRGKTRDSTKPDTASDGSTGGMRGVITPFGEARLVSDGVMMG